MDQTRIVDVAPPVIKNGRELLIAGLAASYNLETNVGIPGQWQRFGPHIGHIAGQLDQTTYGVCFNGDGTGRFDYLCGVEVTETAHLPDGFSSVHLMARKYAVFAHNGPISGMRDTVYTIWHKSLSEHGIESDRAPDFELYGADFDTETGRVEIWIPIK